MRALVSIGAVAAALWAGPAIGQGASEGGLPDGSDPLVVDCVQASQVILRIDACTRLIEAGAESEENLAWAFNNRALAYEQAMRLEKALEDYNTALLLDPTYAVGYNNRGNVQARLDNMEAAIADHARAVELDPDYAQAWFNLAADYEEIGDVDSAIEAYGGAVEADSDYVDALVRRAALNCQQDNTDAAVADTLQLLEIGHFTATGLQEYLFERDYYDGAIDGLFGPGSRSALRRWAADGCPA